MLVLHEPEVEADPAQDGTRTEVFICLHPTRKEILIGGTFYGGEIKKSVFTLMNDRLPLEGVMPMHCSANVSQDGRDVAVFFGLSGTGKTTLSADPERLLIGDDEHGWGDDGVFNFEGGCYAKTIRLSEAAEPEIWKAVHSFGTVLENVAVDERGVLDLDDDSKTENNRAAYKLEEIANALPAKRAGHPRSVIFLAADAFGILPPIARLSREQALFFFLSGYTSKLAGTELGVTEPQPTFSTCFGAPFWPQRPTVYAKLLGEKLDEHSATVWLINTGWTGGPFGEGHRMPIQATRALLGAVLSGELGDVEFRTDPVFGFEVPVHAPRRRRVAARPALDVGRPRGVRPEGPRARADVRRELRDEARRRAGRGRRGRTEALGQGLPARVFVVARALTGVRDTAQARAIGPAHDRSGRCVDRRLRMRSSGRRATRRVRTHRSCHWPSRAGRGCRPHPSARGRIETCPGRWRRRSGSRPATSQVRSPSRPNRRARLDPSASHRSRRRQRCRLSSCRGRSR